MNNRMLNDVTVMKDLVSEYTLDELEHVSGGARFTEMRLQNFMNRRSKIAEALHNIFEKMDSVESTIVQNLKG